MDQLSLLVPGLLGPLPELREAQQTIYDCKSLRKWLACGEISSTGTNDYYQQLAQLFSIDATISVAQMSALVDDIDCSQGHWLRADPVHFKADLDHALLVEADKLSVLQHEAEALIAQFNQHFVDDGLQLHCVHPSRWYLQSQQSFQLDTVKLHEAISRNVHHFLPKGVDELRWRKILNEAQMLFFSSEHNQQREARGQMTINSLWLWGEGDSISATKKPQFDWLMSNDTVSRGLAQVSNVSVLDLNADVEQLVQQEGNGLVIVDDLFLPMSYGDVSAWNEAVKMLCHDWIQPLHDLLMKKKIKSLSVYTGEGRKLRLKSSNLLKFWRRARPLENYINTHA